MNPGDLITNDRSGGLFTWPILNVWNGLSYGAELVVQLRDGIEGFAPGVVVASIEALHPNRSSGWVYVVTAIGMGWIEADNLTRQDV